jgi:uncharacterized membrane protein YphA (DoxX/SURF4 family)
MKTAVLIARTLLGLIFVVFGINFFHPFLPMPVPKMSPAAMAFSGGLYGSGYFFQYLKCVEIISGLFLLINRYTAFFLVVLFPISLNIFLFHAILAPFGLLRGLVIIILNLFLGYAYRKYYISVFTSSPVV